MGTVTFSAKRSNPWSRVCSTQYAVGMQYTVGTQYAVGTQYVVGMQYTLGMQYAVGVSAKRSTITLDAVGTQYTEGNGPHL